MEIEFTDTYTINSETGGMNFQAIVDGQNVVCKVSQEALQDINPKNRNDDIRTQFLSNQSRLEKIAESKLLHGNSNIFITSEDVL